MGPHSESKERVWGILGGMGPLASAEFVRTLYRLQGRKPERDMVRCILYSDPAVQDRTEALREGAIAARRLRQELILALERLQAAGAERMIVTCLTSHALLDDLPAQLQGRIVPLVPLLFRSMRGKPDPLLLISTTGARASGIFQRDPAWAEFGPVIRFPEGGWQERLHDAIYRVKGNGPVQELADLVQAAAAEHGAATVVFGCTELHLLHEWYAHTASPGFAIADPLLSLADLLVSKGKSINPGDGNQMDV